MAADQEGEGLLSPGGDEPHDLNVSEVICLQ